MFFKCCVAFCGVALVLALEVNARLNVSYTPDEHVSVSICVRNILSQFKSFKADVLLMNTHDVLNKHLQEMSNGLLRFNTRNQTRMNSGIRNTIYVMNFEDYNDAVQGFETVMSDKYWTPASYYVIILDIDANLPKLSSYLTSKYVFNVTILKRVKTEYEIYTFSMSATCNKPPLVKVNTCSEYSSGNEIFPIINVYKLRGCRFKILARNVFPMVNVDTDQNKTRGWELKILSLFAEHYGIYFDIIEYYTKTDWFGRQVNLNSSSIDMLSKVRTGEVEGAIGGFYLGTRNSLRLSFGYPIVIDHLVAIMPRADFLEFGQALFLKGFYSIVLVFSLIIIFSILAYNLTLFPTHTKDPIRSFLLVFGYFLNKTFVRKFKGGLSETLVLSCLLFAIFIVPFYVQAFLCSVLNYPLRNYEPQKRAEIITGRYDPVIPEEWKSKSIDKKYKLKYCGSKLNCLSQVKYTPGKVYYTLMEENQFEVLKCMPNQGALSASFYKVNDVYAKTFSSTVYFRHGSVLSVPYDKFVHQLAANGIIDHYNRNVVYRQNLKCAYDSKSMCGPLDLSQLKPVFSVLIGGYCLSAICLVTEVFIKNVKLFGAR